MADQHDGAGVELPKWKSHKIVRAAQISKIEYAHQTDEEWGAITRLGLSWDGREHGFVKDPDPKIFTRYRPKVGDYWVIYDDGYISVSPKAAFEEGYERV
jgi:hypothetical protein